MNKKILKTKIYWVNCSFMTNDKVGKKQSLKCDQSKQKNAED